MNPVAPADFTAAFPEFSDATAFPVSQITFWAAQALTELNPDRFGASYPLASMLFIAHNLALSAQAARGGTAGVGGVGLVSSKSVGSVSKSYDTSTTASQNAGIWNATVYGQRLWAMMSVRRGAVYVPGPQRPVGPFPFWPR